MPTVLREELQIDSAQIDSAAKIEYIVLSRNRQRTTSNAWLRLRPYR
jgi:hypothetical protein